MKKIKICILSLIIALLFCASAYSYNESELYSMARSAVKSKQINSAFMYFHYLLTSSPETKFKDKALFAVAEYYFMISNYRNSVETFIELLQDYPYHEGKVFALVYLLKIAESSDDPALVKSLEKSIVNFKRLILLFKEYKLYTFISPLGRKHKLVYFIDKVEAYIDGELLATISY